MDAPKNDGIPGVSGTFHPSFTNAVRAFAGLFPDPRSAAAQCPSTFTVKRSSTYGQAGQTAQVTGRGPRTPQRWRSHRPRD